MTTDYVERMYSYNKAINSSYSVVKDSISLPSCIREIIEICAYIDNGNNHAARGYLSLFNEKTNEQILNSVEIRNNKKHYNSTKIIVRSRPEHNNLSLVLKLEAIDSTQQCRLVILIKYRK